MDAVISPYLFPHWLTRRTLGTSLYLGTLTILARNKCNRFFRARSLSSCLFVFRVLTESGDRSSCACSITLSLRGVAGHVAEFHIVLRRRCWRRRCTELEKPVDETPDNEWHVVLRITLIFAVLDEVRIRPVFHSSVQSKLHITLSCHKHNRVFPKFWRHSVNCAFIRLWNLQQILQIFKKKERKKENCAAVS